MKDTTIEIRFHPGKSPDEAFTIEPETVDFVRGAELELRLATAGATFPAAGAVTFARPESSEAFATGPVTADGTRLKLRNRGSRDSGQVVKHEYRVTVEHGGASFTSTGYPSMNEHDPPP